MPWSSSRELEGKARAAPAGVPARSGAPPPRRDGVQAVAARCNALHRRMALCDTRAVRLPLFQVREIDV
jgi:hypothetical protein